MTEGKADGQAGVETGLEGHGQESPQLPAREAPVKKKLARHVNWWHVATLLIRVITLILGVAAITSAILLWLVPTPHTSATTKDHTITTVIDSAGHKNTTEVKKLTTTTAPGAARSDAMLVAVLTFGAGLLFVAGLWNRIQEFALGGVSIKLADTAVEPPKIAPVEVIGADFAGSTNFDNIAKEVDRISKAELGLVRIDLRQGDLWAATNLSLFVLLLADRSQAEVIVFSGQDFAGPNTYLGVASIGLLADRLKKGDPEFAAAYRAVETMPLEPPLVRPPPSLGDKLDGELASRQVARNPADKVDARRLYTLAGKTLITASVNGGGRRKLSKQEQREILTFPLSYVPITYRDRLDKVIEQGELTEKIALSAVGLSG
jgi:hypothetical protein